MRVLKSLFLALLVSAMVFGVIGCGQQTAYVSDAVRPAVTSTTPAAGATGVSLTPPITATFSKPMNPATLNATTFKLAGPGGAGIAGTVTYAAAGSTATFVPSNSLAYNTTYVATITTGATDQASPANSIAGNYVWSFTTNGAPLPPTVTVTSPTNGAPNVALGSALTATFSAAMNPSSLNNATFTVAGPGGIASAGAVSYSAVGNLATFVPTVALTPATTYVATITTGAQSASGIALTANYIWTFTTIPAATITPGTPPTVAITNPSNNAPTVPVGQVITATFSKAMTPSTLNASSFTLTAPGGAAISGTVNYAGITASFTPSAALALGTTYVATITTAAQDTTGLALANNYVWTFTTVLAGAPPTVTSTLPAPNAPAVPLNQVVSATFSKAMNPATINASTFTLGAPGGIAVAGTVAYSGTIATFTPTNPLTAGVTYVATVTTGAQDTTGVGLSNNYVWAFTTISPDAAPTVLSTVPANAATGVPLNQVINAVFSKPMNPATLTAATFTVAGPGVANIAGVVSYNAETNTASFKPSDALVNGATYIATITTGAQDTAGSALTAPYGFAFRTLPAPAPPTVITTNPTPNATGVPFNQIVAATFSEAMSPATLTETTFTLAAPGNLPVAGTVGYVPAGSIATFKPRVPLLPLTTYVATVTTGAQDSMGIPMASNHTWAFTTGAAPDVTPPTVKSTDPSNGAANVPNNQAITAVLTEPMDPSTMNGTNFSITGPGTTPVAGLVGYAAISNSLTFTPSVSLPAGTTFTGTITTGAKDLAGNALVSNYVWTFSTGAAPDTVAPTVTLTAPVNGATGVALNQTINATFSEAMNPLSLTPTTFQLTNGGSPVTASISYDAINNIASLEPTAPLLPGTTYTATVTSGATDLAGNGLAPGSTPNPWTFTTGVVVVPPPVNLGTIAQFGGFGGAAGMTNQGIRTSINGGSIGTTGVSTLMTGFHDLTPNCIYTETPLNVGLVSGGIYTAPPPPTGNCLSEGTELTSQIASQAYADGLSAYAQLVAFPNGLDVSVCPGCGGGSAGELGTRTLLPGIYKSASRSYGITTGDLTLDAQGDPNAFWVFQAATSLTVGSTSSNRSVLLVNGAQAKNVYWQVGSAATINGIGGGTMTGTVISQSGVTVSTAGVNQVTTINGRVLSMVAAVTLVNTVINVPAP